MDAIRKVTQLSLPLQRVLQLGQDFLKLGGMPCSRGSHNTWLFIASLAALGSYSKLMHAEKNQTTSRSHRSKASVLQTSNAELTAAQLAHLDKLGLSRLPFQKLDGESPCQGGRTWISLLGLQAKVHLRYAECVLCTLCLYDFEKP